MTLSSSVSSTYVRLCISNLLHCEGAAHIRTEIFRQRVIVVELALMKPHKGHQIALQYVRVYLGKFLCGHLFVLQKIKQNKNERRC